MKKIYLLKIFRVISWCPHCETALAAAEIDYEEKIHLFMLNSL